MQETEDPYSFGVLLGDLDLHLFNEGRHFELARCLGAQSHNGRRRQRRTFRGVGAKRNARRGGRRLQFLGSAASSDARAASRGHLGALHPAGRAGLTL